MILKHYLLPVQSHLRLMGVNLVIVLVDLLFHLHREGLICVSGILFDIVELADRFFVLIEVFEEVLFDLLGDLRVDALLSLL